MNAGIKLTLSLLLLCSALTSGCMSFGGGDAGQSQQAQADDVKKAEGELTAAQLKLTETEAEAKKAEIALAAATDEERKADEKAEDFRAKTVAQGKDPNDEKQSPNTFAALKAHKEAMDKLEAARGRDGKAKADVQTARGAVESAQKNLDDVRNPTTGGFLGTLLYALGGVAVIAALALVGFLVNKSLTASRHRTREAFQSVTTGQEQGVRQLERSFAELSRKLDEQFSRQGREVDAVNSRISRLADEVASLRRSIGAAASQQSPGDAYQGQVVEAREERPFPVSAAEYLSRMRRNAVGVRSDSLNGILVSTQDGNGEMMLVEDYGPPVGQPHVFPTIGSFKSKQEFYSYYEKYFDCPRLTGGEVWIVRPATVRKVNGGWELEGKGELEVR